MGSTWDQYGVNLGSAWGQPRVNPGSTQGQPSQHAPPYHGQMKFPSARSRINNVVAVQLSGTSTRPRFGST